MLTKEHKDNLMTITKTFRDAIQNYHFENDLDYRDILEFAVENDVILTCTMLDDENAKASEAIIEQAYIEINQPE